MRGDSLADGEGTSGDHQRCFLMFHCSQMEEYSGEFEGGFTQGTNVNVQM